MTTLNLNRKENTVKKFLATYSLYPEIEEIEVERETEKFVIVKVGLSELRIQKTSGHKNVRDTYEQAENRLIEIWKNERAEVIREYASRIKSLTGVENRLNRL